MSNGVVMRDGAAKVIPTIKSLESLQTFQRDQLQFLATLPQKHGDIVRIKLLFWPALIINHPDYIRHVLQENYTNYTKNVPIYNAFRPLLGNGLVTNYGGESWLYQRRLMQPAFHKQRIADVGKVTTDATYRMLERWEVAAREERAIDVAEEMMHVTLDIVCKALFDIDINDKADAFGRSFMHVNTFLMEHFMRPFPPIVVPTGKNQRYQRALRDLNSIVADMLRERRREGRDHGDLLSMLLEARDEETGQGMDDQQLRDEIMTLLVAGHETVANALAWCWHLLATHEDVEQRLYAELEQTLAGRTPTVDDLRSIPYARMIFDESMRLYPPVWILMRKAVNDDEIGGYAVEGGSYILWSTYAMHRHPDFWEHPEQFDPEHFASEQVAKRPRHAYVPFSHGPRLCIGNNFALTEAHLMIATIAQRYQLVSVPGHKVEAQPLMTLRPKNGVMMYVRPR